MSLFLTTIISQGSAATRLRCGWQCNNHFVANFLTNSTVKNFRKSVNIFQSYRQKYRGPFLTHSVELPAHTTHLADCTFITRMLYKDAVLGE